jgi:glycine reductase
MTMRRPLRLDVHTLDIEEVRLGEVTAASGHTLTVSADEVMASVLDDPRIAGVSVEVAEPGDDVRIVHCLDAVEPRTKLGEGTVFPGFLGGMGTVGSGATFRLGGVAVLASSRYPQSFSGLLQAREAVVDMAGATAVYSPFSRVRNVVLNLTPNPHVENDDYDDAVRRATLRVAELIADRCRDGAPQSSRAFDFSTIDPDLPNVVYFYQLQGQGHMADTYLYGRPIHDLVPTLIHPNEVIDGAIVSGVYVYACYKNPTYLHQNNPIIWELQERHGRDLNFAGVIINRGHNYTQEDKERSSRWAAKLAAFLEADGAILTAEGGGNSAIDMMLACQYMEQGGIKTTVVSSEAAGTDGYDFPLFYTVPEADAIVSIGSEDEIIAMPEVGRVIGDDVLLDGETPARGPFDLKMYFQYCGTNQLGANVLTGRVF